MATRDIETPDTNHSVTRCHISGEWKPPLHDDKILNSLNNVHLVWAAYETYKYAKCTRYRSLTYRNWYILLPLSIKGLMQVDFFFCNWFIEFLFLITQKFSSERYIMKTMNMLKILDSIQHSSVSERKDKGFRNSDGISLSKSEYSKLVTRKNRTHSGFP